MRPPPIAGGVQVAQGAVVVLGNALWMICDRQWRAVSCSCNVCVRHGLGSQGGRADVALVPH